MINEETLANLDTILISKFACFLSKNRKGPFRIHHYLEYLVQLVQISLNFSFVIKCPRQVRIQESYTHSRKLSKYNSKVPRVQNFATGRCSSLRCIHFSGWSSIYSSHFQGLNHFRINHFRSFTSSAVL